MKLNKLVSVEKYIQQSLYDKESGYYLKKNPIGTKGDFITSPKISFIFSEMIAIWIISFWISLGKPKFFNIVELGPGDGSLCKTLLSVFEKFPDFNNSIKIYLHEISPRLRKIQKQKIKSKKTFWINNFNNINKGPILFFGNEFFDALPIKQYEKKKSEIFERFVKFEKNSKHKIILKKVNKKVKNILKKYQLTKKKGIIEFPALGLKKIDIIISKLTKNKGGILLIDYGFLKNHNVSTLQAIKSHRKSEVFKNFGKADITSLVNFKLLKQYLKMKNMKTNKIVSQGFFLKRTGILERAEILSRNMTFKEKSDIYFRVDRLINTKQMGELFKVLFTYNTDKKFSLGFK